MPVTELGLFGILTGPGSPEAPVAEPAFCEALLRAAPAYGLRAVVFTPEGVSPDGRTIAGFRRTAGAWVPAEERAPDVIYNRIFASKPAQRREAAQALRALGRSSDWSRGLPDKWTVYRKLRLHPEAAQLLPETRRYNGRLGLSLMLARYKDGVFLKPRAGMQGRFTMHAATSGSQPGSLLIRARDGENRQLLLRFTDEDRGLAWAERFIGSKRFIMQPYLQLNTCRGEPFDIRVLVQKNGQGRWELTGMAARLGPGGSLTSNLHGGGTAEEAAAVLREQFGAKAEDIVRELERTAALLPPLLEASCGRLGELGLDFGIDPDGRIWMLEANSKPGRSVFKLTGDREAARRSVENPLAYARYLLLTRSRSPRLLRSGALQSED
ncbi:YheC/YheD family protein [Paenibacillus sp. HN-1]|uniref:YheC/YheD family endospore coat-associated protein n=1 Tax=Paenibacillus TaxID=44249 RepID=UPI001CA89421|nr:MULTISPECIES: YheC/YheD family protein [Paenibacillus]MBY9080364.1 YheC/YheD family protein [Paenibacillus sp. CGMCC 1.18879]MBY9082977.1 YheC/YheD family protein [Paenibacillus sinensis]